MKKSKSLQCGHCFPPPVVCFAVCNYVRFQLTLRDIGQLLFESFFRQMQRSGAVPSEMTIDQRYGFPASKTEISELAGMKLAIV